MLIDLSKNKMNDNDNEKAISAWYLTDSPAIYEPQRGAHFEFIVSINSDHKLLRYGTTDDDNNKEDIQQFKDYLSLSIDSAAIPHFTQNVIKVKQGNTTVNFAGAVTYPAGTFKFKDWIGADTVDKLK